MGPRNALEQERQGICKVNITLHHSEPSFKHFSWLNPLFKSTVKCDKKLEFQNKDNLPEINRFSYVETIVVASNKQHCLNVIMCTGTKSKYCTCHC